VVKWRDDDQTATGNKAIQTSTELRQYDDVDVIINDYAQRGVFSRVQAEKLRVVNDANRINSRYLTAVTMSNTVTDAMNTRARIRTEPKLTDEGRTKMEGRLDSHIIERNGDTLRESMTAIENNMGLAAAVKLGDELIHQQAMVTDENVDGFYSETARQKNRNSQRAIWNEWKARLTKTTVQQVRREGLSCNLNGTCPPTTGASADQSKADDVFALAMGWELVGKKDYNRRGIETTMVLANDETGAKLQSIMVADFARQGYVAKGSREIFDAAFTSNNPDLVMAGVKLFKRMSEVSPGAVVAKLSGITPEYSDIIQAFDSDRAMALITANKNKSPAEMNDDYVYFDANKYDTDNFEALLKQTMPQEDATFWFDATPSFRGSFENKVQRKARSLIPLVGGDMGAAYMAAIKSVKQTYGTDQVTGEIVNGPFATSLNFGNVENGKWAHKIIEEQLPSYNNGEMPANYTYSKTPDFDPITNPSYVVTWIDKDGEYKAIGATFDFKETDTGKEYFKEQVEKTKEIERTRQVANDRATALSSYDAWHSAPTGVRAGAMMDELGVISGKAFSGIGNIISNALGDARKQRREGFQRVEAGIEKQKAQQPSAKPDKEIEAWRAKY